MYFSIEDLDLLKKYMDIWNKVSYSIKKEHDFESICNKNFLKTKAKSYDYEATDFLEEEMPKVGSNYICLAVMLIDLFFKMMKIITLERF